MTIRNIDEANAALQPYVPLVALLTGQQTTLDRIIPLMERLGNPQNKLRVIHVAGTSGKTSTCYYISALLKAGGKKVGLTVSPHIDSIAERVQINGEVLSESEFCNLLGEFLEIVETMPDKPSYFELLYAFAIWVFWKQEVDYAVVETGMGGRYDATNVVTRHDKVCVITDIGFDHTHILGNTLAEITDQKAGIIHKGNDVFMYEQSDEVMDVIYGTIAQNDAKLHLADVHKLDTGDPQDYQTRNWMLAYNIYDFLVKRDGLPNLTSEELDKAADIQVPARMEARTVNDKILIMDGAHNEQKMRAFIYSFEASNPGLKPAILVAFKEGKEKDHETLAPMLANFSDRIITTTFNTSQDLPSKSVDPDILAEAFRRAGTKQVVSFTDHHQAYEALFKGPEDVVVITGSFYLISQLRDREGLR